MADLQASSWPVVLTRDTARLLTEEAKADAAALWGKLLRLYEGKAHVALGYASWAAYWEEEFGQSKSRGYQLLEAARVDRALSESTIVERPANEAVARELTPLVDDPEGLAETWAEVIERHEQPTAAQTGEVVDERRNGDMAVHYSSTSDEWATPQDFFDEVDAEFGFELDVCALPSSAKCARYFSPDDDGLAQEWAGACWMNPPYGSEIGRWVAKAHESADAGATVVCLVPARVDTAWWWDHCRYGEIRFLRGRLKFGGSDTSAPFPSAVVIFGRPAQVVWWERGVRAADDCSDLDLEHAERHLAQRDAELRETAEPAERCGCVTPLVDDGRCASCGHEPRS
jgi:phage N-6-adenine-methyltransferase